jgi:alkylation response protein AidB-like acyl-CoA dehydrogenase
MTTWSASQRFVEVELGSQSTRLADAARSIQILQRIDRLGALGVAAMLLGLTEHSLELAIRQVMERKAFGAPIGSFQALQHHAAEMLVRVEGSRAAVYRDAWALETEAEQAPLLVAGAKAYAGESARWVCEDTLQPFGGIGFTWETDPHIYYKRAKTLEQFYGSTRWQLEAALQASRI